MCKNKGPKTKNLNPILGSRLKLSPKYQLSVRKPSTFKFLRIEQIPVKRLKICGEYSVEYFHTAIRKWSKRMREKYIDLPKRDDYRIKVLVNTLKNMKFSIDQYIKFVLIQTPKDRPVRRYIYNPKMLQLFADVSAYPEGVSVGSNIANFKTYKDAWVKYLQQRIPSTTAKEVVKLIYVNDNNR